MHRADRAIHSLLEGRSKGIGSVMARAALACVEPAYTGIVVLRNKLYDDRHFRSIPLGRPTISVGNLTTGGTGKTPLVLWLARTLLDTGRRPGVLLRGYKAVHGHSDEADELRERLGPIIPVQVDADRVRGAHVLLARWPEVNVLLLDDAFQHRRARRDVDLVVIDAMNPFGFDHVLPRGLLREPADRALARASAVVLTKVDQVDSAAVNQIIERIRRARPDLPVLQTVHRPTRVRFEHGGWHTPGWLQGRRAGAFCGIGNPANFRSLLERSGTNLAFWKVFDDHHAFTAHDVNEIDELARAAEVTNVLTTAKDAARLRRLGHTANGLAIVEVALQFQSNDDQTLMRLIDQLSPTKQ